MLSTCFNLTDPDKFDETKSYVYNNKGSSSSNRWADFSDKSVDFDHVNELFGASNLSKELAAAEGKDTSFGGYDDDIGYTNKNN